MDLPVIIIFILFSCYDSASLSSIFVTLCEEIWKILFFFALLNKLLMGGNRSRGGSVGCFLFLSLSANHASSRAFWLDSGQHTTTINRIVTISLSCVTCWRC